MDFLGPYAEIGELRREMTRYATLIDPNIFHTEATPIQEFIDRMGELRRDLLKLTIAAALFTSDEVRNFFGLVSHSD